MRLLSAVLLSLAFALAQTNPGKVILPENTVKIDGHVTPGAISDTVALRMFYVMSAPKNGASSSSVAAPKGLESFFSQMPASDQAAILERMRNWQVQAPANLPGKRTFAEMNAIVAQDLAELHRNLSGQGWAVLKAELDRRKGFIKIYEVPAPPKGGK